MSNKKSYAGVALTMISLLLVFAGCYKDTSLSPQGSAGTTVVINKTISYQGDIIPLFTKNCALSGCHATGGHKPDLSAANAYNSLSSGSYLNTSAPETSEIYMWLSGKRGTQMPPNGLDATINGTILAWIKQGAKSDN